MESKVLRYSGKHSTVAYDLKRCIHAAECVHGLPAVFDPNKKPWVSPDSASPEQLQETVNRCPAGALHLEESAEPVPAIPEIGVCADGPLYARGNIQVCAMDGTTLLEDTRVALCRCGASMNKPLCDNMHQRASFRDAGAVGSMPTASDKIEAGDLRVNVAPNGPLLLDGPFTIEAADGAKVSGSKAALCRCGASANKPFCDGAHSRVGFSD